METSSIFLGTMVMAIGLALIVLAVFRSLKNQWAWGARELWVLPLLGMCLLFAGRWLMR